VVCKLTARSILRVPNEQNLKDKFDTLGCAQSRGRTPGPNADVQSDAANI
jgi:hypothetical protein